MNKVYHLEMEVQMKRFTTIAAVFGVSFLAVWSIFQLFNASQAQEDKTRAKALPSQNEQMKILNAGHEAVIPAPSVDTRIVAPVFDHYGAVVSDPSGILSNKSNSGQLAIPVTGSDVRIAPVFDSSGAVVSDPSGTLLNASPSEVKIAPVFDANGIVVSDPSGTILNSSNP
jgi:hypothetical protein